jgi:DNA-binding CsgD family transcriptional regulator
VSRTGVSLAGLGREFERLAAAAELTHGEVLTAAAERIAQVIPHDGCCVSGADPGTLALVDTWTDGVAAEEFAADFYAAELDSTDYARHRDLVSGRDHATVLSAVTRGDVRRSPRYRHLLTPMGFEHELRAAGLDAGTPWAFVHLYRQRGRRDFDANELAGLRRAAPKLATAVRAAVARHTAWPERTHAISRPAAEAVTLLVDRELRVVGRAGPVTQWLEQMRDPRRPELPLPVPVLSLALDTRLGAAPRPVRAFAQSGSWWVLQAAPLEGGQYADTVAITALPAQGSELTDLRMLALGFTAGERGVCELVLTGASTKLIAQSLCLSNYTVQDRLKAIFAKAQVVSRGELVALLIG